MTSISKRLATGTGIYGLGSALTSAGNFLLIPFYIHYLTPDQYGVLATATAVMSFLGIIMGLSLDSSLARGYYEHQDDRPGLCRLLSSLFIALALYSAAVLALFLLAGLCLPAANPLGVAFRPVLATAFVAAYLINLSALPLTLLRVQEQARVFVLFNVTRFVLNNALSIYFVARLRWGAEGSLLGTLLSNAVFAVVGVGLMWPYLRPLIDRQVLRAALVYSLPLIPHVAFFWISNLSDRIVLGHFRGQGEVGIYSLGYNLGMGMSLLTTAFNSSWTPIVFGTLKAAEGETSKAETELGRTASHALVGFTLAALAFALAAPEMVALLAYFARSAYLKAETVVPLIVVGFWMQAVYITVVAILYYFSKTKLLPLISGAGAATNLGLNLLLVPRYGMMAAAVDTIIAFSVSAGLSFLCARRLFTLRFETVRIVKVIGLSLIVYFVFEALAPGDIWISLCGKAAVYLAFIGLLVELGLLTGVQARAMPGRTTS